MGSLVSVRELVYHLLSFFHIPSSMEFVAASVRESVLIEKALEPDYVCERSIPTCLLSIDIKTVHDVLKYRNTCTMQNNSIYEVELHTICGFCFILPPQSETKVAFWCDHALYRERDAGYDDEPYQLSPGDHVVIEGEYIKG